MTGSRRGRFVAAVVGMLAVGLALLAAARLSRQVPRLMRGADPRAGIDLQYRQAETQGWFSGQAVYSMTPETESLPAANYPPATYLGLWPVLGRTTWELARGLWALLLLLALVATSRFAWRFLARAPTPWRLLGAVLPWSVYPTAYAFSAGQMGPICLLAILSSAAAMEKWTRSRAPRHAVGSALWASLSLIKPSYSVGWVVAMPAIPAGWIPTLGLASFYGALTLFAAWFAIGPWSERLSGWIRNGTLYPGYGNVAALGLGGWSLLATLALLIAQYLWCRSARPSLWSACAVSAVVSRWAVYHAPVDDGLLLIPMLVLLRHLATPPAMTSGRRAFAGLALAAAVAAQHLPTRLHDWGGAAESWFFGAQTAAFALALCYFLTERAPAR